ncbi:E3 ubiquitin-protein ligase TRIM71-like [Oopsacas minuta]|uniref:E3 ubiquitin-protein ligase TRIM71-like n=1 Tax=Oopsacas minuta TaxID=111878 RepID=A0AAV7KCA7_9METZ|nr:E3 ubiquitin-protein ligase TRIM71-like [Oopsacas minuta]
MATNSDRFENNMEIYDCVNPIEHFGLCPVCLKEFEDPVCLQCSHTVCRGCLKGRDGQPVMAFEKIVCPICQKATVTNENGLDGLMCDTFAKKIAQLSKLKSSKHNISKIRCTAECMQGRAKAVGYCLECSVYLCQLDLKVHQKVTKETHIVIPLKELISKQTNELLLKAAPVRCTYHLDVQAMYYCLTSQLLLCAQCKSSHNPNHNIELLESYLNLLTERTRENLTAYREESEKMQTEEVNQWKKMKDIKIQIGSSFDRLIYKLENRKKELLNKLDSIIDETRNTLDSHRQKMAQLDQLRELLIVKSRYPKDVSMLHSLQELHQRFQDQLNITRVEYDVPYSDIHFDMDPSIQVCLQNLGRFQVTRNILPVAVIKDPGQHEVFSPYAIDVKNQGIFVLVSGTANLIIVFTHTGELMKTIRLETQSEESVSFGGLTVTDSIIIVCVTSRHCLQTYTHEGELINMIGKLGHAQFEFNTPIGLATTVEGHLIVADSRNNRLQVFTPELKFSHFIGSSNSVPGELRYPADVGLTKNNQIVCLHQGNPSIHVYSFTGMLLNQLGSTVNSNELHCPVRLAISQSGHIVTVDRSKPCLAVYGSDTTIMVRLAGMYNEVWGVAFSSQNRLFVCDGDHIKVLNLQPFELLGRTRHSSLPGDSKRHLTATSITGNFPSISDV